MSGKVTEKTKQKRKQKEDDIEARTDHAGNMYKSVNAMCKEYGVNYVTYRTRLELGWSKEDALTKPTAARGKKTCTAPDGTEYPSISEMCAAYGVPYHIFSERIRSGQNVEKALSKDVDGHRKGKVRDFKGNKYKYFSTMCREYNQNPSCVRNRLKAGMSLETALTKPCSGKTEADEIGK